MKRTVLVLMLLSYQLLLVGQHLRLSPAINGWEFGDFFGGIDSAKTGSVLTESGQIFQGYGTPEPAMPGFVQVQSTWTKRFFCPAVPDTLAVAVRLRSGEILDSTAVVRLSIAVQDSFGQYFSGRRKVITESDSVMFFDLAEIKEFMDKFSRLYIILRIDSHDSSCVGGGIIISRLWGVDDTLGVVVYDDFQTTGVSSEKDNSAPNFKLEQNYPNPFNPSTKINFQLEKAGMVSLRVFNLLGEQVAVLADSYLSAGVHEFIFSAGNLPAGVYVYRLQAGNYVTCKKMILLK